MSKPHFPDLDQLLRQSGLNADTAPSREEWRSFLQSLGQAASDQEFSAQPISLPDHVGWPQLALPVLLLDQEGKILFLNEAFQQRFGWAKSTEGQPVVSLLSSSLEDLRLRAILKQLWQGEILTPVPLSLCNSQGTMYLSEVTLSPLRSATGEVQQAVMTVVSSISTAELKDPQQVNRQSFYEQIFEALPAPLVILDTDRRYVYCNPQAIKNPEIRRWIIGKTDEEYAEYRGFDLGLAARRRAYLEEAIAEKRPVLFEEQLSTPQGETVYQRRIYAPIFDSNGELIMCIGHGMDITELRKTQEALRELNAGLEHRVQARTAQLEEATLQLQHDALHDSLTGLPNRALFSDRLSQAIARAAHPGGAQYAVLFLDVDRFKGVNDTLGHPAGDALLVEMGQRLRSCLRATDTVARLGGDEFTILLEPILEHEQATHVADRIQQELRRPMDLHGQQMILTTSIGIVHSTPEYDSAHAVLRDADIAMYRAKDAGRAGYQIFNAEMREHTLHVTRMESELRQALVRNELRVVYQPVVELSNGYVEGFEVLVRWQHPERGLLGAGEFTEIAQDSGLLPEIDRWVLREACTEMQRWQETYPEDPPMSLSINFCSQHIAEADIADDVAQVLQETGFDPQRLKIEITEGTLLTHSEEVSQTLKQLRAQGVGLHLDDFGTGYSSLSYLQLYPLDAIKIDRSFVQGMLENVSSAELVRTIVAMAKNMNLHVVAEGIEQPGHLQALRDLGCERGQGYLFSRPLEVKEARALVVQGQHFLRESWGYQK